MRSLRMMVSVLSLLVMGPLTRRGCFADIMVQRRGLLPLSGNVRHGEVKHSRPPVRGYGQPLGGGRGLVNILVEKV